MVKNAIKVYARLKPDKIRKDILVHSMSYQVIHRPKENVEEDAFLIVGPQSKCKDYPDNRPEAWNFSFFRILEESATQENVFENVARPVVESALDGYNGTIIAYGQTASGKTYTLTGKRDAELRGITPRSLQYLFEQIRKRPENVYSIEVAYLEIYNETGYDLLDRRQQRDSPLTRLEDLPHIVVMEDEMGKLHMRNLSFHLVTNVQEALELLLLGDSNRTVVETPMNAQSSRSHCIFTIVLATKAFGADQYKKAKIHVVDLAGSERVYKCSITGTILTEAKHINLSLHYLEQVIVYLGQETGGHIPYRNSLLTSILRDSLGGNCLTTMVTTLSVASVNLEETVSTCRFAQRVALIKNDAKLNLETDMQSENALLRAENERLRQQLKTLSNQITPVELTAEDKVRLDSQIRIFLETDRQISWDYNPQKINYCFESVKKVFELCRDPKNYLKKLEYYKDLIIQRDKEISLLIDIMKKDKDKKSIAATESILDSNNIQNGKEEPIEKRTSPKKPKRKSRTSKTVIQNQLEASDQLAIIMDKVPCNNVEEIKLDAASRNASKISLIDQVVTDTSISTRTPKSNLLHCNTVNLTLSDSISKVDEASRQSTRIPGTKLKTVETKDSVQSTINFDLQVEKNSDVEATKTPSTEIENSIPTYQRQLKFSSRQPERSSVAKKDSKIQKEVSDSNSNFDEDCKPFDNLPLTGDPDIDEEIIAFYKAKRSGGAY